MATITASAAGGNYNATGTWTGGVVPGLGDDVILASTSGNVTITAAAACRSIYCTGYTGTLTHGDFTWQIGSSSANPSGYAAVFASTMTYALATNAAISWGSTVSASQLTINTAGLLQPSWTFINGGGSYILTSNVTMTTAFEAVIGLQAESFATGGYGVTCYSFLITGSSVRTVAFGDSTITCTSLSVGFECTTPNADITFTANTATLILAGSAEFLVSTYSLNFNGLNVVFQADNSVATISGASGQTLTFGSITDTAAGISNGLQITAGLYVVCTGGFNVTSGATAPERTLVSSTVTGTPAMIQAATFSLASCDFMDIAASLFTYDTLVAEDAPTGWWALNDAVGSPTFTDMSGLGSTLTGYGAYVLGEPGAIPSHPQDTSCYFSGAEGIYGETTTGNWGGAPSSLTFEAWVKASSWGAGHEIVWDIGAGAYYLDVFNGRAFVSVEVTVAGSGVQKTLEGSTALSPNVWHHIVGTYDGTTECIYLDGALSNSQVVGAPLASSNWNSAKGLLGNFNGDDDPFSGYIAHVAMYDYALIPERILAHYQAAAGSWAGTASGTTALGNCQGNSGITFNAARSLFWVGGTGSMSDTGAAHLALTSGGAPGQTYCLAQDTITFDANSFTAGSQKVTFDMPRLGSVVSATTVHAPTYANSISTSAFGNVDMSGLAWTSGTGGWIFCGRGSQTLQGNAAHTTTWGSININAPGGTYTATGPAGAGGNAVALAMGAFIDGGYTITCGTVTVAASAVFALTMSGTWDVVSSTGALWSVSALADLTVTVLPGASIVLTGTPTGNQSFVGGSNTWPKLIKTNASATYSLSITGANTFTDIQFQGASTASLILPSSETTTLLPGATFATSGSSGELVSVASSTPGTQATLSLSSGVIEVDYVSLQDIAATGGATWYAGPNSTNVSDNSGWTFGSLALALAGTSAASSTATGSMGLSVALQGTAAASSSAAATMALAVALAGSAGATSTAEATMIAYAFLAGTAAAVSSASGSPVWTAPGTVRSVETLTQTVNSCESLANTVTSVETCP